jgi:hypothetical protein
MAMIGLALTSLAIGAALMRWKSRGQDHRALGSMSNRWLAACRAGRPIVE